MIDKKAPAGRVRSSGGGVLPRRLPGTDSSLALKISAGGKRLRQQVRYRVRGTSRELTDT